MNIKGIECQFPFLAISYSDHYYHVGDECEPEMALETRELEYAMKFHPQDYNFVSSLLSKMQEKSPEIQSIQEASIGNYSFLLLRENHDFDNQEFNGEVIQRFWILGREGLREFEFLKKGNHETYWVFEALRLSKSEAQLLSNEKINNRSNYKPYEVIIFKEANSPQKDLNQKEISLCQKEEYIVQFSDNMYAVVDPLFGGRRVETRYIEDASRLSKEETLSFLKGISKTANGNEIRLQPIVYKLKSVAHFVESSDDFMDNTAKNQVNRFYLIGRLGILERKDYNDHENNDDYFSRRRGFDPNYMGQYFKPEESASKKVLVNADQFYFFTDEYVRDLDLNIAFDDITYSTEYSTDSTFSWEEANKLANKLDKKFPNLPKHWIVEVVVLKEETSI